MLTPSKALFSWAKDGRISEPTLFRLLTKRWRSLSRRPPPVEESADPAAKRRPVRRSIIIRSNQRLRSTYSLMKR